MPPLPVVTQYGFYYFARPNGRFSSAVKVNGELIYARDYRAYAGQQIEHVEFAEPDDNSFVIAMSW